MNILYIFLTICMLLDCVLLVFLVLLQLPKKEAGAGVAFGGAATDALFGAGSGNVLTKVTKYVAVAFFVLSLGMALIAANLNRSTAASLAQQLTQKGSAPMPVAPQPVNPVAQPPNTGFIQLSNPPATTTPTRPAKQ